MIDTNRRGASGNGRDPETGRFVRGNKESVGRPAPRYDRHLSRGIRSLLAQGHPDGGTHADAIVRAMVTQARNGNVKAAEWVADRAEGKAVQRLDVDVVRKSELLAELYGLDPGEVASMARQIAEEEAAMVLPTGPDPAFEGGVPGSRDRDHR